MTARVVCFPFVGSLLGGSHISACGLIRHLDRQRFEPLVLLQHPDSAIGRLFVEAGIAVEEAPATPSLPHGRSIGIGDLFRVAMTSPVLARTLRDRHVAIVHGNDGRTQATWAAATRVAGARLLWHHRGAPDSAGLRWAAPVLANRIVAVSRFAAPKQRFPFPPPRPAIVHSPFDTALSYDRVDAHRALARLLGPELRATRSTRFIGFSGALIDRKRPLRFVEALAWIRDETPDLDVRGVILGEALDGMDRRIVDRATELGIADRIHLLGFRAPGAYWLAACDILLVPAIDEPFGRTLIEAMLVGTPVVATASGGNVEALRDGALGRLVPPESPEDLGRAALDLLDDPVLARRNAEIARLDALSRFGETMHAEAIMAIYDAMLAPRRSPQAVRS